ncbi:hypothetical protein [Mesobacillus foraminis]|uniref:Uncharacterized protein n=1 Tax=Mesobacillus foraminis TaxID=279826 RepID=A0A4R2BGQ0_9BACI|nr:hypothetical protein [Mesobacillus foraminis]TCN26228.1 hypothetical protein EV146_104338 [Mesobacillus foraminis]
MNFIVGEKLLFEETEVKVVQIKEHSIVFEVCLQVMKKMKDRWEDHFGIFNHIKTN